MRMLVWFYIKEKKERPRYRFPIKRGHIMMTLCINSEKRRCCSQKRTTEPRDVDTTVRSWIPDPRSRQLGFRSQLSFTRTILPQHSFDCYEFIHFSSEGCHRLEQHGSFPNGKMLLRPGNRNFSRRRLAYEVGKQRPGGMQTFGYED